MPCSANHDAPSTYDREGPGYDGNACLASLWLAGQDSLEAQGRACLVPVYPSAMPTHQLACVWSVATVGSLQ
jgi:hypothetical protein